MKAVLATAAIAVLAVVTVPAQGTMFDPDAEGFIRNWLVLAPIALAEESGATEIDNDYLKGEATAKPKAGDQVTIGAGTATWTPHKTDDFFIDFLVSFGKVKGEYVAGYAVAYVMADEPMSVNLALGTNDQGKAWLNGKEVFKLADARTLDKDQDRIPVTLNKGQNVLMLKVINEVNNWQGCARFLRGEAPVKNVKISLAPQ
jgi:hypothetical protein